MDLSNALCTFRTGNAKLIIDKREMIIGREYISTSIKI